MGTQEQLGLLLENYMRCLVTGAAGFVGSHLVDWLLRCGHEVIGFDNLSTGQRAFLGPALRNTNFSLIVDDLLETEELSPALARCEAVFHFAANADVRNGSRDQQRDLRQNTIVTSRILEVARKVGVKRFVFASTAAVYGDASVVPTPEDAPFPVQTSFYGASKLAAEGLVAASCAAFGLESHIFRFVSMLGPRYTHGHVFDFFVRLTEDPQRLAILGDGNQRKSYLQVEDAISGVMMAFERVRGGVNIFNVGHDETLTVRESADTICQRLGLLPQREYGTTDRGWVGDTPMIALDCRKLRRLGWRPNVSPREAVIATVDFLRDNPAVVHQRRCQPAL